MTKQSALVALVVVTVAVYSNMVGNDFAYYDDEANKSAKRIV